MDDELLDTLLCHVRTLHLYCQKANHSFSGNQELDQLGTSIWNLSTRSMRNTDGRLSHRKLGVYARSFAFYLLDAAQYHGKGNSGNVIRLMRLALKAAKSSLGG